MTNTNISKIETIAVHSVGNKLNEENLRLTKDLLQLNNDTLEILLYYFLTPFKSQEYYHLYHDVDLNLNETYNYVLTIFNNPETLLEQSVNSCQVYVYSCSWQP